MKESSPLLNAAALTLLLLSASRAEAAVTFPSIISDNMVLQQQTDARLWGHAKPDSDVTLLTSWSKEKVKTKADAQGEWSVTVATPEASYEPQYVKVTDADGTVTLSNVLIGEVWYCSGQSNMEMPMKGFDRQPVEGALDMILQADPGRPIRMFTVEKDVSATPLSDCRGRWNVNDTQGVTNCSATAWYFADYLNNILHVPVGVIISSWGGIRVQPWMSREAVEPFGIDLSHLDTELTMKTKDVHMMPCTMYNAMVAPLKDYAVKGMLWYQGESNSSQPELYEQLMPAFVDDMREKFGNLDMPFYYVQIAPHGRYRGKELEGVCRLRVAQSHLMEQRPHTGMAVTMDIGDDVCIHPRDKKSVGKRLALWALHNDYGKNSTAWSGPIYESMERDAENPGKVYLRFRNAPGGVAPQEVALEGFEAAGEDGIYYPAHAMVEARKGLLAVTCEDVPEIKSVRYGNYPFMTGGLFDCYGLPASPFVTTGSLD